MRAPTAVTATALAAAAATVLSACGGGSGGSSGTVSPAPSAASTSPAAGGGTRLTIDPAFVLPAGLRLRFAWPMPPDHATSAALNASANFMESMVFGVVRQSTTAGGLPNYAADGALTYAKEYVQNHIKAKKTVTGTDLFYRPKVTLNAGNTVAEVTFCENQSAFFSKEIPTGKVHTTTPSDDDYTSYDLVVTKAPTKTEWWQVTSVDYTTRAVECKQ